MAISTYGELKTAILAWADDQELTAVVADFVRLAEIRIRREIRTRDQLTAMTTAMTDGVASLPSRFLEARQLVIDDSVIRYVPEDVWVTQPNAAEPVFYTITGSEFKVQGGSTETARLDYWKEYAAFSAEADTNWLLTNAADVYLWAGVSEAYTYTRDVEGVNLAEAKFEKAKQALNKAETLSRIAGPMAVRAG